MQWGMVISILAIEDLFQQVLDLCLEILDNRAVLHGTHQMLELGEDRVILAGVELPLLRGFQELELKEQLEELIIALGVRLHVYVEEGFDCLEAFGVLAHGPVVYGVPPVWLVLLGEHLPQPHEQVPRVLLEEGLDADVELLMALHGVGVVEDRGHQVPVLDVHVLEPVTLLLTVQLVEQGLLQVDPLDIQNHDETLVVALVAEHVEHVPPRVVHVHLLMNDI